MDLENKIEELKKYFQTHDLTIVGLNDSQGVNTTTLFRKGILEYIADCLNSGKNDSTIINAFSLMFNKTEHIDYLLEGNLSLEEIKNESTENSAKRELEVKCAKIKELERQIDVVEKVYKKII